MKVKKFNQFESVLPVSLEEPIEDSIEYLDELFESVDNAISNIDNMYSFADDKKLDESFNETMKSLRDFKKKITKYQSILIKKAEFNL